MSGIKKSGTYYGFRIFLQKPNQRSISQRAFNLHQWVGQQTVGAFDPVFFFGFSSDIPVDTSYCKCFVGFGRFVVTERIRGKELTPLGLLIVTKQHGHIFSCWI